MDVSDYIGCVRDEGERFANAAERGSLTVEVPPCPGWDMRELVRHLGLIHLWAATNVAFPKPSWLSVGDLADLAEPWPDLATNWPGDADLIDWYRATNTNLIGVLEAAPDDVECFTFLPAATPLTMWARRQASEIAIHRFDAELSRGMVSHFDPQFATDMLDELVSGFAPRTRSLDVDSCRMIHLHADDVDDHWYVSMGPQGIATSREGDRADLTVTGTAGELYLAMWNRTPDSTVRLDGDCDLMALWHRSHRVRWS